MNTSAHVRLEPSPAGVQGLLGYILGMSSQHLQVWLLQSRRHLHSPESSSSISQAWHGQVQSAPPFTWIAP